MKDLPLFTTPYGIASVILRNIPYTKMAYVRLGVSETPEELMKECYDFCRAAGAEEVYFTGHSCLIKNKLHTRILKLQRKNDLPNVDAVVSPVQTETMEQWRQIYNDKMAPVPTAAMISFHEAKKYIDEGTCCFVHRNDTLLGIGVVTGNRIDAIASVVPGMGRILLSALSKMISVDTIELIVADNNLPAMKLYESLGFEEIEVIEQWYKIF